MADVYDHAPTAIDARETKQRLAVDRLTLRLPQGQVIGLLGPNGEGKTTTIKMLWGLLRPSGGDLEVLGYEPAQRSFDFLRQISVVFGQKSMLFWDVQGATPVQQRQQLTGGHDARGRSG